MFRSISRHRRLGENGLSGTAIALIVKWSVVRAAVTGGLTEAEALAYAEQFAGHSLRSGLATSAAANDVPGHAIQRQLRRRKFDTTAGYIRAGHIFKQNAVGMAGL